MVPRRHLGRALAALLFAMCAVEPASATMPLPSGHVSPAVSAAFEAGLFDIPALPSGSAPVSGTSPSAVWQIPIVIVRFSDTPLQYGAGAFDTALFDTSGVTETGSMAEYYQWASGGQLKVRGRVVAVVDLPFDRHYYGYNSYGLSFTTSPNNLYGLAFDALSRCHTSVDWTQYDRDRDGYVDMVWFLHTGEGAETSGNRDDCWSITSRMSGGWRNGVAFLTNQIVPGTTSLRFRIDRFSTVPELSGFHDGERSEIGVFCHEFGHALGLPDLYDTSSLGGASNVGPGNWSLMSTGGYGTNGITPEYPAHMGGWCSVFLGWRQSVRLSADTTLTLPPLGSGGDVIEYWYQGTPSPEHFLLESRARLDFDRNVQYEGLIVTHVDEAAIGQRIANNRVNAGTTPGLWIVEADGDSDLVLGRNRGDAYDPFPGLGGTFDFNDRTRPSTLSFSRAPTNLSLEDIRWTGSGSRFFARVRGRGWKAPEDHSPAAYLPVERTSAGPEAVRLGSTGMALVKSENATGRPQVFLHESSRSNWLPRFQVSESPTAALDPAIAALPSGDLAVAWSDARSGRSHIRFRARIGGIWTEERAIESLAGDNLSPSIALDDDGRIHLAWLNLQDNLPRVYFARFLYFAPFAQSIPVTLAGAFPGDPSVVLDRRSGRSYTVWIERSQSPQRLYFARFFPDSGLSLPLPLTPTNTAPQVAFSGAIDSAGTFYSVWATSGENQRELRYQRRFTNRSPSPRDTVIESLSGPTQHLSLAIDPSNMLHVAHATVFEGRSQVYYKHRDSELGWDLLGTEVSDSKTEDAVRPWMLPESPGNVSVLYTQYGATSARLLQRDRELDPRDLTDVESEPAIGRVRLTANPNPLRGGTRLTLRWSGPRSEAIDLFDLAGRRVASVALEAGGEGWIGAADSSRLPAGMLFARARGVPGPATRLVVLR